MGVEFKTIKIKKGFVVRDPGNLAALPETAVTVPWIGPEGRYWRRRLRDGSIELAETEQKIVKKIIKEEIK